MKYFFCLALAVIASVAHAKDLNTTPPSVSFAAFPLPLVRMYVTPDLGKPAGKAELKSPFPDDFPPAIEIAFEDKRGYKTPPGSYAFLSRNVLRVYRISDMQKAPYKTIQEYLDGLRDLLKKRPASVPDDKDEHFPDYPSRNSAQAFDLHIHYIDADWGSGICYMTLFTQDGSNHASNDELQYLFQGLSKDGSYYVSVDFHITHPKLEHWRWPVEKADYKPDIKLLSSLKESSFIPTLPELWKWLASLKIE